VEIVRFRGKPRSDHLLTLPVVVPAAQAHSAPQLQADAGWAGASHVHSALHTQLAPQAQSGPHVQSRASVQAPAQVQLMPQAQSAPQVQVAAPRLAQVQRLVSFAVIVMVSSSSGDGVAFRLHEEHAAPLTASLERDG
jgi:hypothetical protein